MTSKRNVWFFILITMIFSLRTMAQGEFYQVGFELYRGSSPDLYDEVFCVFETGGNAAIDNNDLPKLNQFNENLSVYRNLRDFGSEIRPLISCTDTVQLRLYNTSIRTYRIIVNMLDFPVTSGLSAVIQDVFLNTERNLKFGDTSHINFSVTSSSSSTGQRFRVIFRRTKVTTTPFTPIPAICSGESINLPSASTNGINGTWTPAVNNTATTTYTFIPSEGQCATSPTMTVVVNQPVPPAFNPIGPFNSGTNFTLPSTSNNGINGIWSPAIDNTKTTTYTFIPDAGQCATTAQVTVTINDIVTSLSDLGADQSFKLYPNPMDRGVGTLQFELGNYVPGKYRVSVYALDGIRLKDMLIHHSSGRATYSISLDNKWKSGTYIIRIFGENNLKAQKILFIK